MLAKASIAVHSFNPEVITSPIGRLPSPIIGELARYWLALVRHGRAAGTKIILKVFRWPGSDRVSQSSASVAGRASS